MPESHCFIQLVPVADGGGFRVEYRSLYLKSLAVIFSDQTGFNSEISRIYSGLRDPIAIERTPAGNLVERVVKAKMFMLVLFIQSKVFAGGNNHSSSSHPSKIS